MQQLKPNETRARTAIIMLWIVLAAEILSFISGLLQYNMLNEMSSDGFSYNDAELNDMRELFFAILYLLAFIISAVTFIQWFRRAWYNLHLKVKYLEYSEGWAAGGWFVPVMSFFVPYRIMSDLYKKTAQLLNQHGQPGATVLNTTLPGWWWAFWIINNFMGQVMLQTSSNSESVSDLITGTILSLAGNIIGIIAAVLAIRVIKTYASVEPLLFLLNEDAENKAAENNSDIQH